MIERLKLAVAIGAVVASMAAAPAGAQDAGAELERVAAQFRAQYPATRFTSVKKSEIAGLYEVVMGDSVAYTDAGGRFFVFGHLFDMQAQIDLTAQRKSEGRRVEFPAEALANAIKTVKGDGSRAFAVFSDPDCGYCKKLEGELAQLDNVTIYTFLFPLDSIHPEAKTKAVAVWCAADRQAAWTRAVLTGTVEKLVACNNPVNDNLVLGTKLGVTGTPTLIAADGRVMPGAAPAARIDQWLNAGAAKVAK